MTQGPNIQARLREGIDAAKRGDRLTARRMLQQVLAFDRNNEMALMWMASVVDTVEERRSFLQRVLQVNPDNARAREALRRLSGDADDTARPASPGAARTPGDSGAYVPPAETRRIPAPTPTRTQGPLRRLSTTYLFLAGAVVLVMAVIIGTILLNPARNNPSGAGLNGQQGTVAAFANPATVTPTPTATIPVPTVFMGVIITLDPAEITPLPPSYTPTATPTYTPTPFPSLTPFPLESFSVVYADFEPNVAVPSLYTGNGDGSGEVKLESGTVGGFTDAVISPDGQQVAFIRDVEFIPTPMPTIEGSEDAAPLPALSGVYPQLFIGPIDNLAAARAVTSVQGELMAHPSWSPDGESIVFASDLRGSGSEIYRYDLDEGDVTQITRNDGRNFDPAYAPDGTILFASDMDSPGFSEIYRMDREGQNIVRLTNDAGSSYAPAASPDGTRIAFISDRQGGDADLYVMDADGQRPFLLTLDDSGAEDRSPAWSPNSLYIVFASNRGGREAWYTIDSSGTITRLTDNDRFPQSLSFIGG